MGWSACIHFRLTKVVFFGPRSRVTCVAWSLCGRWLASGGGDNCVKVILEEFAKLVGRCVRANGEILTVFELDLGY